MWAEHGGAPGPVRDDAAESYQVTYSLEYEPYVVLDGATVANLSPGLAEEKGLDPFITGVAIVEMKQGVAAQLGLQPGDLILALNGQATPTVGALNSILTATGGRRGRITVSRGGGTQELQFAF